ncbi:hypothetical protein [Corynebacterium alimapuense]|uniref:Uncharacterized protein n=1 Tax=Corynebacterium alimapuense TaxID=1576874 RepID=A0A3M8KA06_9CORY|nr:hypothetical protein [Corynebacterium alimapuense]RNE49364.1 hypothetical protein C5L39_03080 [Corynebacterium alimapuense]
MNPVGMSKDLRTKSLLAFYFGGAVARDLNFDHVDTIRNVSKRAYRDVNRTMHGIGALKNADALRAEIYASVIKFVAGLEEFSHKELGPHTQEEFNQLHRAWCLEAIETFSRFPHHQRPDFGLHYGQAQKWLNMTLKYLAVLDHPQVRYAYPYLHVPLDSVVFRMAEEDLKVKEPSLKWSRLGEKAYLAYQDELYAAVNADSTITRSVMDWEAEYWIKGL